MIDEHAKELHSLMENYCTVNGYSKSTLMGFLSALFVGTMAMNGYDEDFVDSTLDLMKKRFRSHPLRKNEKNIW